MDKYENAAAVWVDESSRIKIEGKLIDVGDPVWFREEEEVGFIQGCYAGRVDSGAFDSEVLVRSASGQLALVPSDGIYSIEPLVFDERDLPSMIAKAKWSLLSDSDYDAFPGIEGDAFIGRIDPSTDLVIDDVQGQPEKDRFRIAVYIRGEQAAEYFLARTT